MVRDPLRARAPMRTGLAMTSELSATANDEAGADPVRIGRLLRESRIARGETLAAAAAWLRLREDYLAALERGEFAALPGRPYVLGFLRSYADHLGLSGHHLAGCLKPTLAPVAVPRAAPPTHPGGLAVILACLLVAVTAWALQARGPKVAEPEPEPAPVASAPAPAAPDAASAAAAEPTEVAVLTIDDREDRELAALAASGSRLALVGRGAAWIQLRSGDRSFVRSGMLAAGQRIGLPARRDLLLSASDGGALDLELEGATLGPAGAAGQPLRDLPLDLRLSAAPSGAAR